MPIALIIVIGWLYVTLLLVAKGGGSRELVIDRKSGRLIEGASAQEWPPKGQ